MGFSRPWLLGAALGALVAGAARAQEAPPDIHFVQNGSGLAVKTHVMDLPRQHHTATSTVSTSISTSSDLHKKTLIWSFLWYGPKKCGPPKAQHYQLAQRKTAYALIHTGNSMGTINGCGATLFKFRDIYYTLATKRAVGSTDQVRAALIVPFYLGYELTLNIILNVYIGP